MPSKRKRHKTIDHLSLQFWGGLLAAAIGLLSYIPYIRSILGGTTKPHLYSWLIWTIIMGVISVIQYKEGASFGAYVSYATFLTNFTVFCLALKYGTKDITFIDHVALGLALISIVLWMSFSAPLVAVIILCFVQIFAIIPTYRKTWIDPSSENPIIYFISVVKFTIGIFCLGILSLENTLFPVAIVLSNAVLCFIWLVGNKRRAMK